MSQYSILLFSITILFLMILSGIAFFWYRKISRRAKDVERSLKMIPLLVKLPPQESREDNRDSRELIKENISRAEGMFNLLSGISAKHALIYTKKYLAFEIIATGKTINFYVVTPVSLLSAVQKALTSGYPDVQIVQTEDTNIFSEKSKIAGVQGGILKLKKENFLPIATYKDNDTDALTGILATISNLEEHEGAGIQILIRPTRKNIFGKRWEKQAMGRAKQVLNPGKKGGGGVDNVGYILKAPFRSPDDENKKSKDDKQPDSLDQHKAELIEQKAKSPAFETMIRIIASSDDPAKAKILLQDIKLGFAQLSQGGANRFKFKRTKSPQKLATDFIFRFFPHYPSWKKYTVLNSVELATIFHIPSDNIGISTNIERKAAKEVAAPAGLPTEGMRLGLNMYHGTETPIFLTQDDKRRHVYIIGQTGTGKSVLLTNMMLQDAEAGRGFCFIDPNGDEAERLLGRIPAHRAQDVIYFSPGDTEYPIGLNIMDYDRAHPEQKDFLVQEMITMLYKLYDPTHQGIIGPQFENWFRNAALTVMADPEGGTYIQIPRVFTDDEFLKKKFRHVTDPTVQAFWTGEMAQTDARTKSDMLGYFASKFGAVANNEMLRHIIGQNKSALNFREVMDTNKILIVNLSKGLMGEINAKLLGMIFVIKLQVAAMSRADIPEEQRVDFGLYVDEFQNIATDSFATILSEARKYHFNLTVANQYIDQIDEQIRDAVFGNVGSMVIHRVGNDDAEYLAKQFEPQFDMSDLANIPNHFAAAKIIANGTPTTPFSMKGYPPINNNQINVELQSAMRDLSRSKYGRPRAQVMEEVAKSLDSTPQEPPLPSGASDAVGMGSDSRRA